MWTELIVGFTIGVYFASEYNCRPIINRAKKMISEQLPEPRVQKRPE